MHAELPRLRMIRFKMGVTKHLDGVENPLLNEELVVIRRIIGQRNQQNHVQFLYMCVICGSRTDFEMW